MMHVFFNVFMVWGLWQVASGVKDHNFFEMCGGLLAMLFAVGFLGEEFETARRFGKDRPSYRPDGICYVVFAGLRAFFNVFYHLPFKLYVVLLCSSFAAVGIVLTALSLSPSFYDKQVVFLKAGSGRGGRVFRLPEYLARLALLAVCLALAAIVTLLLVKNEELRVSLFLVTVVVGLVATNVLPLKALKWILNSVSLGKLRPKD